MSGEASFRAAFWALLALMVLLRAGFAFRVRQAGERVLPDWSAVRREGWLAFAIRCMGLVVLLALVALVLLHLISIRRLAIPLPPWLRWAGFALGLASLGLWTWVHLALGRLWSAQLTLREGHRLVTAGPYSRVRHPMYAAILGWISGLCLVISNWIALVLLVWAALIFLTRIPREEKMMLERFGDEYREYQERTGRFLPRMRRPRATGHNSDAS